MARRMVVVPEEFLKVFKQEPQIPLNFLRNEELLADRLNKALHQRTTSTSVSTQTSEGIPDNTIDRKPFEASTHISQSGINETLATPTASFTIRAPEQQSTPSEFHSRVTTPGTSKESSELEQRIEELKDQLKKVKAWDTRSKQVNNWEGGWIKGSNIDAILSYAFNPEGGEPPLGFRQIARHLKIMEETGFPNKDFQRAVDQASGQSPVRAGRRRMPTPYVFQKGKGNCCKKRSPQVKPIRWTTY
jgi:hypothetical protein